MDLIGRFGGDEVIYEQTNHKIAHDKVDSEDCLAAFAFFDRVYLSPTFNVVFIQSFMKSSCILLILAARGIAFSGFFLRSLNFTLRGRSMLLTEKLLLSIWRYTVDCSIPNSFDCTIL